MLFSREGGDSYCSFATALFAQPLWCMFGPVEERDVPGPGTGRKGMALVRMESTTLVLKALNTLHCPGLFELKVTETPCKLAEVRKRICWLPKLTSGVELASTALGQQDCLCHLVSPFCFSFCIGFILSYSRRASSQMPLVPQSGVSVPSPMHWSNLLEIS